MLPAAVYTPAQVAGRSVHHVPPGLHLGSAAVLIFVALMVGGLLLSAAIRVRHGRWLVAVLAVAVAAGLGVAGWRAAAGGLGHGRAAWIAGAVAAAGLLLIGARVLAGRVIHGRRARWLTFQRRLRWHLPPGPGWASGWALWRYHGLPAARRVARHARPSLSWLGLRMPGSWREYAAFDGWAPGWLRRHRVYSPLESVRLTIAAPQEGKSAAAAGTILDAPGPVVATSIRGDLLAATAGLRARRGQVHIWNPEGVGEAGSTLSWNPVDGCQDMTVALRRADYMVEAVTAGGLADEDYWRTQARLVLAAYLHAAALAGGDLRDVYRWVLELDPAPVRILSGHPGAAPRALSQAIQYREMPSRTRSGISTTINGTLRFMQHPAVMASLAPAPGEGFDFEAFLAGPNTLYLVASDAVSPVSPLFTAILAELTTVARQLGAARSPGRLDPPLSLVLDEVANIAPVPAAQWATWAAGSGIWMHLYAQAWAKLGERWGEHGAAVLWQAAKAKIIYTATSEPELCQMVEDLCGTVRVRGPDDWRYTRTGRPGAGRPTRTCWCCRRPSCASSPPVTPW